MKEEKLKNKILETAVRLFYEQGYNTTGINQVIDESGIAKGSLYYNYKSKADLLLAYLNHCHEIWFSEVRAVVAPFEFSNDKILALFDFKVVYQERCDYGGCPFIKIANEVGNHQEIISAEVMRFKVAVKKYIGDLVLSLPEGGNLYKEDLTNMIFLLLEGADVSSTILRSSKEIRNAKKIIEKFL